jgi:4-hydroxy-4-methyl-2-oxoglutarate aldolase
MPEPRPVALIGELLATQVKVRGAAAILVGAAVRDVEELKNLGLPLWTHYIRVRGADKTTLGAINVPVVVGGARISPGDMIVLDSDGGVCIPREKIGSVLKAAESRLEREAHQRQRYLNGELSYDLNGLRDYVEQKAK